MLGRAHAWAVHGRGMDELFAHRPEHGARIGRMGWVREFARSIPRRLRSCPPGAIADLRGGELRGQNAAHPRSRFSTAPNVARSGKLCCSMRRRGLSLPASRLISRPASRWGASKSVPGGRWRNSTPCALSPGSGGPDCLVRPVSCGTLLPIALALLLGLPGSAGYNFIWSWELLCLSCEPNFLWLFRSPIVSTPTSWTRITSGGAKTRLQSIPSGPPFSRALSSARRCRKMARRRPRPVHPSPPPTPRCRRAWMVSCTPTAHSGHTIANLDPLSHERPQNPLLELARTGLQRKGSRPPREFRIPARQPVA